MSAKNNRQTEAVAFRNIDAYVYTYMHVIIHV